MTEKITFRMSGAGHCPRALSAELLDYEAKPIPSWLAQAANEGNWHEKRIKQELVEQGYQVFDEQEEQIIELPTITMTGHIDGKVYTPDKVKQLLEVKSMSVFEFDRWMKGGFAAFPNYMAQITCYLAATKLDECLYIVKNRNNGYVDRRVITPADSFMKFESIADLLSEVAEFVERGELFPAEFDLQSIECRRCNYQSLCIPEPAELDKAAKEQLDKAVEDIRLGNKLLAEGKEFCDKGKKVLYDHTKASNLRKWKYNEMALLMVSVKENITYPKEALLRKYGAVELADVAKVKEAYDYLKVDDLQEEK